MTAQWQFVGSDESVQHYGRHGWRLLLQGPDGHRYDLYLTGAFLREQKIFEPGEERVRIFVQRCLNSEQLGEELQMHRQEGDGVITRLEWDSDGLKRQG